MPGKATGRVASMPRLTALTRQPWTPCLGKLGSCHLMPVPKETEAKLMRQNRFVASKQPLF